LLDIYGHESYNRDISERKRISKQRGQGYVIESRCIMDSSNSGNSNQCNANAIKQILKSHAKER